MEDCPGLAFKNGDRLAFDRIVESFRERVFRVALRILRDRDEAWDVSQETFLKIYQKIGSWDGKSKFFTWVFRVATNLAIDRHRRRQREARLKKTLSFEEAAPSTLFEDAARAEQMGLLRKAVADLPPGQQAIVVLRHFEGLSLAEIAEVRGCALGTVKSTLFQAFRNLQKATLPERTVEES